MGRAIPALVVWFLTLLIENSGTLVGRVLVSLGLMAVTYTGLSTSLNYLKAQAVSQLGGLPADVLGILGVLKVGESISLIVSAIATRMVLDGLQEGGSISRWVKK